MDRTARGRTGFSLIELTVVMAILGLLMSLGYAAIRRGRTTSKETVCLNNLKQISAALNLYLNDHGSYPPGSLSACLSPYVGDDPSVFICPSDPDARGDSYSRHYVCRADEGTRNYVCGCPLHLETSHAVTLFTSASAEVLQVRPVHWNGQPVAPGTKVGSGALTFADGSRVTIPADMVVELVQSFRTRGGSLYSIIRVGINETGTLDVEVTPGSRFEVITPAAIAGVQGTRFKVTSFIDGPRYCVKVSVSSGAVAVKNRWLPERAKVLTAGQQRDLGILRARLCELLRAEWLERRIVLPDDHLYEILDSGLPVPTPQTDGLLSSQDATGTTDAP